MGGPVIEVVTIDTPSLGDLPHRPLWVYCQGGYRASIAASLLQAAGYTVTAVDDDLARAASAGLPGTWRPY